MIQIALLVLLVTPTAPVSDPAALTRASMRSLALTAEAYRIDHGVYPPARDIAALAAAVEPVYIKTAPLADAWGTPFRFFTIRNGSAFFLMSAGPDRAMGTADDIVVRDKTNTDLQALAQAAEEYRQNHGKYPTGDLTGLLSAMTAGGATSDHDAWGTLFRYVPAADGQSFSLASAGPDKKFGTDDDLGASDRTTSDLRSIETAVEAFAVDHKVYPVAMNLSALAPQVQPTYIRFIPESDVWGTPFRYESSDGKSYTISSAGADKTFGTADDISVTPKP